MREKNIISIEGEIYRRKREERQVINVQNKQQRAKDGTLGDTRNSRRSGGRATINNNLLGTVSYV